MKRLDLFFAVLAMMITFTSAPFAIAQEKPHEAVPTVAKPSGSPIAEQPQYLAGEKWVYSRNGKRLDIEFLRQEDSLVVTRRSLDGKTELWYYSFDLNPVKVTTEDGKVVRDYSGGEYALHKFPLYVGKTWASTYYSYSANAPRRISAEVTAYEQITVPAGTFWTFRIELTNQRHDRAIPAYETLWYAPDVKRGVKHFSRELWLDIELLKYIPVAR